ncbi:MAG: class I SAM-dependent methyltransferase [Pseudomonadota bacterium]
MTTLIDTWTTDASQEDGMTDEHAWIWREMIAAAPLPNGPKSRVLDIGCNQGGFLRMLHDSRPFSEGVGVDLAREAVAIAEANKGARPLRYVATDRLAMAGEPFDIAFSHEVIYLIEDLGEHAAQVAGILRPGGSYYAVTCCHRDNPLWAGWRSKITDVSRIPVPDHSPDDIIRAFLSEGFNVSASRFLANAQIPMLGQSEYFPSDRMRLDVYSQWKLLFRFTRPE